MEFSPRLDFIPQEYDLILILLADCADIAAVLLVDLLQGIFQPLVFRVYGGNIRGLQFQLLFLPQLPFHLFRAGKLVGSTADQGDKDVFDGGISAIVIITGFYTGDRTDGHPAFIRQHLVGPFQVLLSFCAPLHKIGKGQQHEIRDAALPDAGAFDTLIKHGIPTLGYDIISLCVKNGLYKWYPFTHMCVFTAIRMRCII